MRLALSEAYNFADTTLSVLGKFIFWVSAFTAAVANSQSVNLGEKEYSNFIKQQVVDPENTVVFGRLFPHYYNSDTPLCSLNTESFNQMPESAILDIAIDLSKHGAPLVYSEDRTNVAISGTVEFSDTSEGPISVVIIVENAIVENKKLIGGEKIYASEFTQTTNINDYKQLISTCRYKPEELDARKDCEYQLRPV